MKRFIIMLAAAFCLSVNAQESKSEQESKSATVELLKKDGILLKKDFYEIGSIPGVSFENIVLTDLVDGKKTGALRIKTSYYISSSLGSDTYIGTLDYDELEGCIKSLKYLKENVIDSIPQNYVEYIYKTKDGVSMGLYLNNLRKVAKWSLFVKTKDYTDRSQEFMAVDKLDEIIAMMEKSVANLKEHLNEEYPL